MPLYRRPGSPFWWVRIGRKTRRSTGTKNRAEAEEFERMLTERLWRREKLGDRGAVSWAEVCERWLRSSAKKRSRDREFIDWLAPQIGEYPVSSVAHPDVIEELRQNAAAEGWAPSTIDRLMNTVRAVLRRAVLWQMLERLPEIPMYRPQESEPRWLTGPEFERLAAELPAHLELAARFAVLTGLRMGAMLSLTWDRIDLAGARAWIPAKQMKGGKTHAIPLSPQALAVLKAAREFSPSGRHVFQYEGTPIRNCYTAAFRKAVKRAGVGPLRWHDLRHTFAAWAVQSGVTLQELMALGGWASYRMALRYAHLAPSQLATAAQKVGAMVAQGAQNKNPSEALEKSSGTAG